jgi:hypothetical protein
MSLDSFFRVCEYSKNLSHHQILRMLVFISRHERMDRKDVVMAALTEMGNPIRLLRALPPDMDSFIVDALTRTGKIDCMIDLYIARSGRLDMGRCDLLAYSPFLSLTKFTAILPVLQTRHGFSAMVSVLPLRHLAVYLRHIGLTVICGNETCYIHTFSLLCRDVARGVLAQAVATWFHNIHWRPPTMTAWLEMFRALRGGFEFSSHSVQGLKDLRTSRELLHASLTALREFVQLFQHDTMVLRLVSEHLFPIFAVMPRGYLLFLCLKESSTPQDDNSAYLPHALRWGDVHTVSYLINRKTLWIMYSKHGQEAVSLAMRNSDRRVLQVLLAEPSLVGMVRIFHLEVVVGVLSLSPKDTRKRYCLFFQWLDSLHNKAADDVLFRVKESFLKVFDATLGNVRPGLLQAVLSIPAGFSSSGTSALHNVLVRTISSVKHHHMFKDPSLCVTPLVQSDMYAIFATTLQVEEEFSYRVFQNCSVPRQYSLIRHWFRTMSVSGTRRQLVCCHTSLGWNVGAIREGVAQVLGTSRGLNGAGLMTSSYLFYFALLYGVRQYIVSKLTYVRPSVYIKVYGPQCRAFRLMRMFLKRRYKAMHNTFTTTTTTTLMKRKRGVLRDLCLYPPRPCTNGKAGWVYRDMEERAKKWYIKHTQKISESEIDI